VKDQRFQLFEPTYLPRAPKGEFWKRLKRALLRVKKSIRERKRECSVSTNLIHPTALGYFQKMVSNFFAILLQSLIFQFLATGNRQKSTDIAQQ